MNVLHIQYSKVRPDILVVKDLMWAKFAWLRWEIRDGMTVEKIPFLKNTLRVSDLRFFIHSQLKINVECQYKPNSMLK